MEGGVTSTRSWTGHLNQNTVQCLKYFCNRVVASYALIARVGERAENEDEPRNKRRKDHLCFLISQPRAPLPLRSINLPRFLFSYARSTTSNRENGGSVNRLLMAFFPEFSGLFRLGSVFSLGVSRHLDAPAVGSTAGASRHPSAEAEPMDHLRPEKPTFL